MVNPPSPKQAAILNALSDMLENPGAGRITTAALAQHIGQSEAALYRHYPGKAAMFKGLIALIDQQLHEDLAHIVATEPQGRTRLRKQAHALLLFVERHPGAARVLTGGALVGEHHSVQEQLNTLLDKIQNTLAQSAELRARQEPAWADAQTTAAVLLDWIRGCWLRYALSGWQARPTADLSRKLSLLGL